MPEKDLPDYYAILQVSPTATQDEISKAYRRLAKEYHPDKAGTASAGVQKLAEEELKKINNAYDVLGDAEKRRNYDKEVAERKAESDRERIEREKAAKYAHIQDLYESGDFEGAIREAEDLHARFPDDADCRNQYAALLHMWAVWLAEQGRLADAAAQLRLAAKHCLDRELEAKIRADLELLLARIRGATPTASRRTASEPPTSESTSAVPPGPPPSPPPPPGAATSPPAPPPSPYPPTPRASPKVILTWVVIGVWSLGALIAAATFLGKHSESKSDHPNSQATSAYKPVTRKPSVPAPVAPIVTPPGIGYQKRQWTNSLGMIFVPVPGTSVQFSIWDTRVRDFAAFVQGTGYEATKVVNSLRENGWKRRGDTWKSPGFPQGPTHPVVDLSWGDAKEFCKWLTQKERDNGRIRDWQEYRLPTDAEWSIAVGRTEYPWGNQWPPPEGAGNYAGEEAKSGLPSNWLIIDDYNDGWPRTSPVGSFRANQFGLYDMGGNVWQWVEDLIGRGQTARVIRGGSWRNSTSGTMRSSNSAPCTPDEGFCDLGFRCVLAGHSFN